MKKLIVGILTIAVLAGFGCGVWWVIDDYITGKDIVISRTYEGRLYLPAEEYEVFKQYLADNPQVEINKLDVLSSPNALVAVKLTSPADTLVPYGEMTEQMRSDENTLVFAVMLPACGLIILARIEYWLWCNLFRLSWEPTK